MATSDSAYHGATARRASGRRGSGRLEVFLRAHGEPWGVSTRPTTRSKPAAPRSGGRLLDQRLGVLAPNDTT